MVRMKRGLSTAGIFIALLSGARPLMAQISPAPRVAAETVQKDHYPAHAVNFPNGVTGLPGIVFWKMAGYRPLALDLYLPPVSMKPPAEGFPFVAYIHGGGWLVGDTHRSGPFVDFPGVLASLAARGYVVASVEYRLSGEAIFPASIQDIKAAIRWLRAHAAEYKIDAARGMTWGPSAGGTLAALASVSCGASALEPVRTNQPIAIPDATSNGRVGAPEISDCVMGSVSWFGVFDFATIAAQAAQEKAMSRADRDAPEWRMLGCFADECKKIQIAGASPVSWVSAKSPPMLLIVGDADKTVPHLQTLEMAERLKTAGSPYELIVIPGVDHVFIGKTPEETREACLKALDATFRFIDKTMKNIR
jgi:acetyl esterase/lipase